jgi:hypothetical protein
MCLRALIRPATSDIMRISGKSHRIFSLLWGAGVRASRYRLVMTGADTCPMKKCFRAAGQYLLSVRCGNVDLSMNWQHHQLTTSSDTVNFREQRQARAHFLREFTLENTDGSLFTHPNRPTSLDKYVFIKVPTRHFPYIRHEFAYPEIQKASILKNTSLTKCIEQRTNPVPNI